MDWWLKPWTPDPEVRGSSPTRVAVLCHLARHIYPPKVLVIPRKRWLCPNMTEKLLSIKQTKNLLDVFDCFLHALSFKRICCCNMIQ